MDQWLDSLSEDWPSQPPTQHNSSSILRDEDTPKSNRSQSRIPRRISSNVLLVNQKELGRRRSLSGDDAATRALKERTFASLNASQERQSNGRVKSSSPDLALQKNNNTCNRSSASNSSMLAATVAFKASPAKKYHETPEWKRRIVQGKIGPGDQTDMFGPIGLQSVFKPPTVAVRPKAKTRHASFEKQGNTDSQVPSGYSKSTLPGPDLVLRDQKRFSSRPAVEDDEGNEEDGENEHTASALIVSERQEEIAKKQPADLPRPSIVSQHSKIESPAISTSISLASPLANSQNNRSSDQSNSNDFTPFYVSKSHTIDGKVDYAAIDMGLQRLHSNVAKLRRSQEDKSRLRSEDNDSQVTGVETLGMSLRKSQMNEITNQSLPEDLSVGTDAFVANGAFVSLHRGGHSNEGSFLNRPLSPSSFSPMDGLSGGFTRASSQALPFPQNSQRKSQMPSTQPRTPTKDDIERPRSSGSPLKLFDKYDTFTNNRLARHISRFEETLAQDGPLDESFKAESQPSSPSPGPKILRKPDRIGQSVESKPGQRVSSFGSGELNDHDFNDSNQILSERALSTCLNEDDALRTLPSRKRGKNISRGSRRPSRTNQNFPALSEEHQEYQLPEYAEKASQPNQHTEVSYTAHGKRLSDSPPDLARKRRRTLCSSEERKRATLSGHPMPSIPFAKERSTPIARGRKRKDARYDNERQVADPKTLATRQILRPRNPTPNQASFSGQQTLSRNPEHPPITITGYGRKIVDQKVDAGLKSSLDPPTQIVAGALATIALNTVQDMASGSRKTSVTTSDFFNEAQQIMALIRAEKRPRSSHNSAETTNFGQSTIREEPSEADSTKDDLTRPPSRVGEMLGKIPLLVQRSARIVSHLRKFEDKDDSGLALPSSGKSLRINDYEIPLFTSPPKLLGEEQASDMESDPPNIRIREGKIHQQEADSPHCHRQRCSMAEPDTRKFESRGTSSSATENSLPTGSSHSSANLKKIAPQSVAHLLSDQMADMFFDKERRVWVKRKASSHSININAGDHATSQHSEEDLFGDIPDLSVDEMEELRRVKDAVSSGNASSRGGSTSSQHNQASTQKNEPDEQGSKQYARPSTADGKVIPQAENSSAPSKYTNFAWSGPVPGTRATSYGDDIWPEKTIQEDQLTLPVFQNTPLSPEIEHEISIFESREPRISMGKDKDYRQPRVVTVAFSSPLVQSPHQVNEDLAKCHESKLEESPSKPVSQSQKSVRRPNSSGFSHGQRHDARRLSVGNSSFIARPMSRLDELDEMSLVRYSVQRPQTTMDVAISTPLPLSGGLIVPPTAGRRSSIGFDLSPLADFTVHQIDQPLDAQKGKVVKERRPQAVSNALSLTAQELVKHLTDTEPYEPYWDHLLIVDLTNRSLTSLHMLDEFCGRTQELDVGRNCIRELDGVPSTVRSLNISDNCLSELTAWHTLQNLQYLNVSGNNLRSLKGFQSLLHLRALKADDNEIENLDGIQRLDGLLSLSLRGNCLGIIKFNAFNLKRLAELDLHRNKLIEVAHLDALESLKTLDLSMNKLENLPLDEHLPKLQTLDIADNCLNYLDVTSIPNLRALILDRNSINQVQGLNTHQHLETLSWRDQNIYTANDNYYQGCHEIRNLYLSRNSISRLNLDIPLLNLNTLELASMGMQRIPEDLGLKCRNLRILNLNYNAIHDTRPLLGIARLQKLYLAGNRLSRLRRTAVVLDRLATELVEVDLRNNNLTVGFYTPQKFSSTKDENRLILRGLVSSSRASSEEDRESLSTKASLLPDLDKDTDDTARERLDEDTKLRRRVYEMLIVSACRALRRLDGLEVDRNLVGRKDGVWERLIELGILKAKMHREGSISA